RREEAQADDGKDPHGHRPASALMQTMWPATLGRSTVGPTGWRQTQAQMPPGPSQLEGRFVTSSVPAGGPPSHPPVSGSSARSRQAMSMPAYGLAVTPPSALNNPILLTW